VLIFGASSASADFIFDLGTGNSAISGNPGPYAQVDVHLVDSTHATITFRSLTNNGNIYLMGAQGAVGFNVNASSWTLGTISGTNAGTGFTPGPYSDGGAGNEGGFGSFNQTIDSFAGYKDSADKIVVNLTDTSGTWADASQVLIANASGNLAAAHIFVTASPADASGSASVTGFAGGVVPAPPSAVLLGLGAFGLLGFMTIRRLRWTPAAA
jgi:hypothetical protein